MVIDGLNYQNLEGYVSTFLKLVVTEHSHGLIQVISCMNSHKVIQIYETV